MAELLLSTLALSTRSTAAAAVTSSLECRELAGLCRLSRRLNRGALRAAAVVPSSEFRPPDLSKTGISKKKVEP